MSDLAIAEALFERCLGHLVPQTSLKIDDESWEKLMAVPVTKTSGHTNETFDHNALKDGAWDSPAIALPVVETFHSIQGEGAWAGTNAFFIRLAGCDVGCPWCDTKHSWNAARHSQRPLNELVAEAKSAHPRIVVITGGEPLMHNLDALTQALRESGLQTHLETSGSHPFSGTFDWVTFSPKPFKPPHPSIYAQANELKVVVTGPDDLTWAETQASRVSQDTLKTLQPEWGTPTSTALVCQYVLEHPEWRVSLQTHKFMHIP